ncbi:hypothetical protein [Amantichitinum ursilacus]|uniref:hypothetical protein n=1 Tax=Amantichitinum ursilacus TaxID=857265 RepID=UPI00128F1212|nr:hypothetical protein [Amantichitinum ursilacus]
MVDLFEKFQKNLNHNNYLVVPLIYWHSSFANRFLISRARLTIDRTKVKTSSEQRKNLAEPLPFQIAIIACPFKPPEFAQVASIKKAGAVFIATSQS